MLAKAISEQPGSDVPIMKAAASTDTIGISEVDYAYLIYRKEAYQTAASLFETIVHKYPNYFSGRRALAFLYKCNKHLSKGTENLTLLDNVSSTYATEQIDALAKNIAAGELIKQGDYQAAIARSEAVTNSFAKTAYAKQALFNLGNTYWYFLADPKTGEIYYRQLIAVYPDDDLSISALATLGEWKPDEPKPEQQPLTEHSEQAAFSLDQNYPNPFNPETTIRYHLSEASRVTIKIYNLVGAEVVTLIDGTQLQGDHAIQWSGRDRFGNTVANGVYWLRLQAGKFVRQQKLVVVR
jgi:tetratricopeptide (TPR) repeat protein